MVAQIVVCSRASHCDEQIAVTTCWSCSSSGELQKDEIIDNWQWQQIKTCKTKWRLVSGSIGDTLIPHVYLKPRVDDNGIYWQAALSLVACTLCTAVCRLSYCHRRGVGGHCFASYWAIPCYGGAGAWGCKWSFLWFSVYYAPLSNVRPMPLTEKTVVLVLCLL